MAEDQPENDRIQTHVALTKGTMVGHYRIMEKIGAGGMCEVYLAAVIDLYSRLIVDWAMRNRITIELTLKALHQAVGRRAVRPGLLHHLDRGNQYAAGDYRTLLRNQGIICSMSRKGNCRDNAPMESFFATLKTELVQEETFMTREETRRKIFEYIEVYYDWERRYSTLGYESPVDFKNAATLS